MSKHKWTFASVGNVTRVTIHTGEDIRHLGELDKKMWTVLSCPVSGLEISEASLSLMDVDGDGKLRVADVVATADWLCAMLHKPDSIFAQTDVLSLSSIADESMLAVAQKVSAMKGSDQDRICLADVDAALASVTVEEQAIPEAPFAANVMAAYKAKSAEYAAYFEQEKLQKLGLAVIAEDVPKPGMTEKKFVEMGSQIAEWEAAKAAAEGANSAALAAAKAEYMPLRKLLLIHRDFYRLLRNFVAFEDFYDRSKPAASFQCGTLIIDQRACHLCIRVNDMGKHALQAPASGIYLVYCDCESKTLGKKMQIVAAMTQGDIHNLSVGKNAVFYDNAGNDYDATVTKIIDNPISILQAFWTPYRKLGNWITEKINKSAAEKDAKIMTDVTTKLDAKPADGAAPVDQKPAFDIAKFAGIFAAIGMAVGMIGTALASIFKGLFALSWWQLIILFVGIVLVISGPAMVMAWMKLHRRNIAPLLNANGWAVNANAKISIPFGETLTEIAKYPKMKLDDPFAKKGLKTWQKWTISILFVAVVVLALWIFNVLNYVNPKMKSPLPRYNKAAVEEVVNDSISEAQVEVIEEVVTE